MDDSVAAGDFREPGGVEAVDEGVHEGEGGHDADDVALGGRVGEVGADGDGGEQHLGGAIGGGRGTADLADEVEPAYWAREIRIYH